MAKKILVVDDNLLLLQSMCEQLEELGYETIAAQNGYEALESCEQETPDLIIMDLVMPDMGGVDATKLLRRDPRFESLPVIAFTSQLNQEQRESLFDDYLIKPFDYDALIKMVQKFLHKP